MAQQQKTPEFVLGVSFNPEKLYSFLQNAISRSSSLRMVAGDKAALKAQLSWKSKAQKEYYFDFFITCEGDNLCDIHFLPASLANLEQLSHAVASVLQAISSYGNLPIVELNEYTDQNEEPSSSDVEKIAMYLDENGIANLNWISKAVGLSQSIVANGLHRLIHDRVVSCSPSGSTFERFYFRQHS